MWITGGAEERAKEEDEGGERNEDEEGGMTGALWQEDEDGMDDTETIDEGGWEDGSGTEEVERIVHFTGMFTSQVDRRADSLACQSAEESSEAGVCNHQPENQPTHKTEKGNGWMIS